MRIRSFKPNGCLNSSFDAQRIFQNNTGRKVNFNPFIINFYKDDIMVSSICWKGDDINQEKEDVIFAFSVPKDIATSFDKTEYFALNTDDIVIINNMILTIEKNDDEFLIMELPYISSSKHAISLGNTLTGLDTSFLIWDLAYGLKDKEKICVVWLGLCLSDPKRSLIFPMFAKDKYLLTEIDDVEILEDNPDVVINNALYKCYLNDETICLDFVCHLPQGLPS